MIAQYDLLFKAFYLCVGAMGQNIINEMPLKNPFGNEMRNEDEPWVKETRFLWQELWPVESTIEAFPQFLLITALAIYDGQCFGPAGLSTLYTVLWILKYFISWYNAFCASGLALSNGPLSADWDLTVQKASKLRFLSLLTFMTASISFSYLLFKLIIALRGEPMQYGRLYSIFLLISTDCFLQIGFQMAILVSGIGFKQTLKVFFKNPRMVMIAMYAPIHYDLNLSFSRCLSVKPSMFRRGQISYKKTYPS